jgi:signal transduction histidine kinase
MKRSFAPLVVLVLLSGAGLLAAGLVGLWRAVGEADLRARVERHEQAGVAARELRAVLGNAKILERTPAAARFALADGMLVVPDEIGWFETPPPAMAPPLAVEGAIRDAQVRELAGDAAGAATLLDEAARGAPPEHRVSLALAAGWIAARAGADVAVDALAGAAASAADDVALSVLLLHAAAQRALPDWARARVVRADPAAATAVVARLAERGAEVAALRAALADAEQQRATLRAADAALPLLAQARTPLLAAVEAGALLFFPETGAGAVLAPRALLDLLPLRDDARFAPCWQPALGEEIVPVSGPLALAVAPLETAAWRGPWRLTALLAALGATFALGLFFALRALRREAAAQRARAEFLTSVTHELKTPLASIRLLAEMLEDGRVPAERQGEYHALLAGESVRLAALIDNVLDLGRLERRERAYDRRVQEPAAVVRAAVELFAPLAARDGLDVRTEIADDRARAAFDRGALEQVLLNVMENARKYAKAGGLLSIDAGRRNGAYHVRVRDRGPGVPAAEREAIFARFVRGARQADGAVPGVGLGLHLARRILRDHGGDIVCEPPADGGPGACFHLTLPLHQESEA